MLVNTAVDIIGPEGTSKCYNNAKSNSNSELAKNPIANPLARPELSLFTPNNIIQTLSLAGIFHVSVPCPFVSEEQDFPDDSLQFHQSVRFIRN